MKTIARNILWRWFFLVFIIVKLVYNNIKHYNARINIVIVVYAHDDDDYDDAADNDDDDYYYYHHCDHQNLSDVTEGQLNKTFTSVI